MPFDDLQRYVIAVISRNRDPESPLAGGAVIQQHCFRTPEDQDIFAAGNETLDELVQADRMALEEAGFTVNLRRSHSGFRECTVMKPMTGTTILQWTVALAREFYAPVPDPQFGHRLHPADLAVNKALAVAGSVRKRDFVDLWMLDRHVMPLWRMACAAPGKDTDLNPFSLIEDASFNWSRTVRRDNPADRLTMTAELSLEEIGKGLRKAMREARLILPDIRPEHYGRLQIDAKGRPVVSREIVTGERWKAPELGGALPTFDGIDSEMIAGLIAQFGLEGSRYTGSVPTSSETDNDANRIERNIEHADPFEIPDPFKPPSPWDE